MIAVKKRHVRIGFIAVLLMLAVLTTALLINVQQAEAYHPDGCYYVDTSGPLWVAICPDERCTRVNIYRTEDPVRYEWLNCPPPPIPDAPSLWLAAVCEPNDGFSNPEYGNIITIGSDAVDLPYGTTLYYGTSIDGPWTATEFDGPNYILSKTQIEALADSAGVELNDLWFMVSEAGSPANLGSMITDRTAGMDSICNPSE